MKGPVDLFFFSGTGNTALASGVLAGVLEAHGIPTRIRAIEDTDPATLSITGTLGIACPVAAFTTYPLVWRFIRNLPPGRGAGAFLLATMGGASLGLKGPLKRILKAKGYAPLGARCVAMPGNFLRVAPDHANRATVSRGLAAVEQFAEALTEDRARWTRIPGLADLVHAAIANDRPFAWMRRRLPMSADPACCTRCGLCAAHCPSSNIRMPDLPRWADRCELCMRCLSICPVDAVRVKGERRSRYLAKPEPWLAGPVQP